MKNILAIDIGNTNITAGIFKTGRLACKAKTPTHCSYLYGRSFRGLARSAGIKPKDISGIIISSVVPLALSRLLVDLSRIFTCKVRITGRDIRIPIPNRYRAKDEVGQDRLVNAYAARKLYGSPAVVVDFGTAVTFDVVSEKGEYLGGLIMPGIELSLSTLHRKTALLPKVELKSVNSVIGRDTESSMRGGILFGFGSMCDGLASKYKAMLGRKTIIIATGGNAKLIKKYAGSIRIVDEDLTLKGLYLIDSSA